MKKIKNATNEYVDYFMSAEKEKELLKKCYKIVVKAVHVKTDKYDFMAYKIKTKAEKWLDLWINYSDVGLVNFINENKEVEIYVKRGFVVYHMKDNGYYVASLIDWYVAQEFIDKTEDKQ